MIEPIVELRDVFCVHRTGQGDAAALQGAELEVGSGEVVCVIGPSGAGKSTLLRVISGLQTPSAGVVRVVGSDIGRQRERARAAFRNRYLGLLGQSTASALCPDLPVVEAVELPLVLRGHSQRRERRARAMELLERVGLGDRTDAVPSELSGGERQRVALCAAVVHRPALLLADEPTGELDQASAREILRLIDDVARATAMSVVIATHDPATARLADRTLTISGGRIAEESRDHQTTVVITQTGWLRIPPHLQDKAGIGDRARVDGIAEGLRVSPASRSRRSPDAPAVTTEPANDITPARVETRSLVFGYSRERAVLDGLTHDFGRERMTVITGRSGSGKTTLLRLIAGLEWPDAGEVLLDAQPLAPRNREELASLRRRRIGYMPQEPAAVEFLSALENVLLALHIRGIYDADSRARASSLLRLLALSERSPQHLSRLSAGETQRVALARALASARGLLVLDEPTSRLDEANARIVARVLAAARGGGQTIICASHDPLLISEADELLALD
jgi:ABC-type lipoprotein export system ATPase subunit